MAARKVLIVMDEETNALDGGDQLRFLGDTLRISGAMRAVCLVRCNRLLPMLCAAAASDFSSAAVVGPLMYPTYHCELVSLPQPLAMMFGLTCTDDGVGEFARQRDALTCLRGELASIRRRARTAPPLSGDRPTLRHLASGCELAIYLGATSHPKETHPHGDRTKQSRSNLDDASEDGWAAALVEAVGIPVWCAPREYREMQSWVLMVESEHGSAASESLRREAACELRRQFPGWSGPIEVLTREELAEPCSQDRRSRRPRSSGNSPPIDYLADKCLIVEQSPRSWWRRIFETAPRPPAMFRVSCPRILLPPGRLKSHHPAAEARAPAEIA